MKTGFLSGSRQWEPEIKEQKMIRIRSKNEGFRRCGVVHSKEWREHANEDFTKKQIEQLKAEPMLQVEVVDDAKGKK